MVLVGIEDGGGGVSYYLFIEFKLFACSDDEKLFSLAWDKCPRVAMHKRNVFNNV